MSVFLQRLDQLSKTYELSTIERLIWLIHYPLIKILWHAEYGRGVRKSFARMISPLFKGYAFWTTLISSEGRSIKVPVAFDPEDYSSFSEVFFGGEYDFPWEIKNIHNYIDLGANTGMAALYFATTFPLKKAILIEANPNLVDLLRRNTKPIENCDIENFCISGNSNAVLKFYIAYGHRHSSLEPIPGAKTIDVAGKTLSEVIAAHKIIEVDLLKFDIEGAEYELLDNDSDAFRLCRHIVAEVHGDVEKRVEFATKIEQLGFEVVRVQKGHFPCENLFARRVS